MKRSIPEIQESIPELEHLLKRQKKARRRERLQMLYLLKTGQARTRRSVARMLSVHRTTVSRWLNVYEREGLCGLLSIRTRPNNRLSIPPDILHKLEEKLKSAGGFRSYKAIQLWLSNEFGLSLPYKTVHRIVRYYLGAKLKVGRRSHVKKNQQESHAFKENFRLMITEAGILPDQSMIRLFSQDESRFGLLPIQRRKITLPGVKPISQVQHEFKTYYLYGAVDPLTGDSFFLELPGLNSGCFQVFLDEFSEAYSHSFNLLLLDRGKFHQAQSLRIPSNVALILLPPYSPELNPIERLWEDIKDEIADELFSTIEALKERVASILKNYTKAEIQSLTAYPYLTGVTNDGVE